MAQPNLDLNRIWVAKYQADALDEDARAVDLLREYEARIATLERMVGRQALELEFFEGGLEKRTAAERRDTSVSPAPRPLRCRGMPADGFAALHLRAPHLYDAPAAEGDEAGIVARIAGALRHQGAVVNGKKSAGRCARTTYSPGAAGGLSPRPTAITTGRSSRTGQGHGRRRPEPALGCGTNAAGKISRKTRKGSMEIPV